MNEWISEYIKVSEWVNEKVCQWVSDWMNKCVSEYVSEWKNEWVSDKQMIEYIRVSEWVNKQIYQWVMTERISVLVNMWVSDKMSDRVNKWMIE